MHIFLPSKIGEIADKLSAKALPDISSAGSEVPFIEVLVSKDAPAPEAPAPMDVEIPAQDAAVPGASCCHVLVSRLPGPDIALPGQGVGRIEMPPSTGQSVPTPLAPPVPGAVAHASPGRVSVDGPPSFVSLPQTAKSGDANPRRAAEGVPAPVVPEGPPEEPVGKDDAPVGARVERAGREMVRTADGAPKVVVAPPVDTSDDRLDPIPVPEEPQVALAGRVEDASPAATQTAEPNPQRSERPRPATAASTPDTGRFATSPPPAADPGIPDEGAVEPEPQNSTSQPPQPSQSAEGAPGLAARHSGFDGFKPGETRSEPQVPPPTPVQTHPPSLPQVDLPPQSKSRLIRDFPAFPDLERGSRAITYHDRRPSLPDVEKLPDERGEPKAASVAAVPATRVAAPPVGPAPFSLESALLVDRDVSPSHPGSATASANVDGNSPVASYDRMRPEPAAARSIMNQVVHSVSRAQGEGVVEIRLQPEELGRVRMTMTPSEAGITVQVTTERPETLELMRRNVDMLAADLSERGFSSFNFSFGADGSAQDREFVPVQNGWPAEKQEGPDTIEVELATKATPMPGRLDIRV